MSMDQLDGIERLAPEVDESASWALFEKRRARGRRRRAGVRALAGGLVVGCAALVVVVLDPGDEGQQVQVVSPDEADGVEPDAAESSATTLPETVPPTTEPIPEGFGERREIDVALLATSQTYEWHDAVEVITDTAAFEEHWRTHRFDLDEDREPSIPPPVVDFESHVGLLLTLADGTCPNRLHLEGEGDTLLFVFDDPGVPCLLAAGTIAYLVVVDRDQLLDSFTLRLTHAQADPELGRSEPVTIPHSR